MGVKVLHFLVFLLALSCSGTSVRVSSGGGRLSSSPANHLPFLKRNGASHIGISDEDYRLLREICGKGRDVDLYISMKNIVPVSKSKALAVDWVQREVSTLNRCTNISSIVVNSEIMKKNHLPLLLPAIKAIDSALATLKLDPSIGLSASFSLPFIEDCFRTPQKPSSRNFRDVLAQVIDFLHGPKCYLTLEASCGEELGLDDCLANLTTRAISVLPDHDLPLQINLRRFPSSSPISFFTEKPLVEEFKQKELNHGEKRLPPSLHRELLYSASEYINGMAQSHIDTPASVPVINPMTPTTATPVVTPLTPSPPTTMTPITTPMTTPPASSGMTNPPPSGMTNPPASSGQSWCVASQSASETALQVALDYACGYGGADCSAIQKGGSCFNPDTLRDHASYAFNDYYQKNPAPTSCNFGGTAVLTNTDPSTSTCQYPSSSPTSSVINTTNPTGSTVFGPEPPGSFSAASSLQSWTIIVTLACLLMLLIAVDHL
ncbi:glucan endo-1,3-beta-glucosidase 4-like isoform X1 [Magnolia sinica]|uniref:glucan endo-1,3-beta-glucosidase 4-like isoform X1 n=1 Tax=Magnolia sinica TaxID=86752 RepID=UPI002659F64B|nr:glucan endo-1,3-beta-glucosidase 4-like isoform X1 [Magnolia sinica]